MHPVELEVNGHTYNIEVELNQPLLYALRDQIGLTGTKEGCDDCECGACTVLLDGKPINSCSYLAVQAGGRSVTTVEGLSENGDLHPLQSAFIELGGVQCGFCTPGVLMSAKALLDENSDPDDEEIKTALAGNLCRCTGYQGIIRAVKQAAAQL